MVRLPLTPADIERGRRIGAVLREARGPRSMLAVAVDARVSPETLRKIESGRVATPSFPTVAAVARVLELSLDDLWARVEGTEGPTTAAGVVGRHTDAIPGPVTGALMSTGARRQGGAA